jgi:hypothetical protein
MNRSNGDLLLLASASLFASWTVYCYLMVLFGSGFHTLLTYSFIPLVGGFLLLRMCLETTVTPENSNALAFELATSPTPQSVAPRSYGWLLAVLAAAAALLFHYGIAYWIVWALLLCIALLVTHRVWTGNGNDGAPWPHSLRRERIAVAAIAIFCAALTAVAHRSDLDDSEYLNFVVTALDFPVEPLFSHSGLWADHSTPLELPLYRFHSYELLIAAFSSVTGVDHKVFYYLLFPPLFAALAALVHWRLAQFLSPRYAVPTLLAWLVLLIALGESHRNFGNFAFTRLYQGKCLLVTVALSYCLLQGLRFSEAPTRRRAIALGVTVMASLGLSSSALAAVPVMVAAVLVGGLPGASRAAARNILRGGIASIVILMCIAFYLMTRMPLAQGVYWGLPPSAGNGLATVLGDGLVGALVLALFPLAPLFVTGHRRRQLYATCTVFFAICVLNPWASPFVAKFFDLALQWRLFWSVPLVISAAIALAGLAAPVQQRSPRMLNHAVLPLLLLTPLLLSSRWSTSPDNLVTFERPRYKVELPDYDLAAEIVRVAPPRSTVYAPSRVAAWLATFRHHPYPLVFRPDYFYFGLIEQHVGLVERERRLRVTRFLEGEDTHPYTVGFFKEQLAYDLPSVVVYADDIFMARVIGSTLEQAGYSGKQYGQYWLWQRQKRAGVPEILGTPNSP